METNDPDDGPFAVVHDIAATWGDYAAIRRSFTDGSVEGLILHAAGPTEDGLRLIDVWTSQGAWQRHSLRLGRILDQLHVPSAIRELRVDHLTRASTMADTTPTPDPRSNRRER